jgi:hypothetical protein
MANEEHLAWLKQRVATWNQWWKGHCPVLRQRCALAFQQAWETTASTGRQGLQILKETSRKAFVRPRGTSWQAVALRHRKLLLLIGVVIGVVVMVGIIWKVPQWQVARWEGRIQEAKEIAKLQNDARTTLVQTLGGAVLLIGLYFTLRNLQLTQDRQITEHYTRAVEQLGSDKLEVRLGAIYALARIARDSEKDHRPIMEILTAYVRENAPSKAEEEHWQEEIPPSESPLKWTGMPKEFVTQLIVRRSEPLPKLAADIQAVLTVLGRRPHTYREEKDQPLNLSRTNLRGAHLEGAQLQGIDFRHTQLQRANLQDAQLQGAYAPRAQLQCAVLWDALLERANLEGAQLQGAKLIGAQLQRANLQDTQLQEAYLIGAKLQGADFRSARLQGAMLSDANLQGAIFLDAQLAGANLAGAQLTGARGLTIEQLSAVETLYKATLDLPLKEQIKQRYPHLLDAPYA